MFMRNSHRRSERDQILDRYVAWGIIIGALSGVVVFVFTNVFPLWQPIATPPEKAADLLAYRYNAFDDYTLYTRATSGNIYAYRSSDYGASDVEWREVEQVNRE